MSADEGPSVGDDPFLLEPLGDCDAAFAFRYDDDVRLASSGPELSYWWKIVKAVAPSISMPTREIVSTPLMTRTKRVKNRDGSRA